MPTQMVNLRLEEELITRLDAVVSRLQADNPKATVTRSSLIKGYIKEGLEKEVSPMFNWSTLIESKRPELIEAIKEAARINWPLHPASGQYDRIVLWKDGDITRQECTSPGEHYQGERTGEAICIIEVHGMNSEDGDDYDVSRWISEAEAEGVFDTMIDDAIREYN